MDPPPPRKRVLLLKMIYCSPAFGGPKHQNNDLTKTSAPLPGAASNFEKHLQEFHLSLHHFEVLFAVSGKPRKAK